MGGGGVRRGSVTTSLSEAQEGRDKRQWRDKRQRPRRMGGSGMKIGDKTTGRTRGTRGTRGDCATRGHGLTKGAGAGRWEAAARPEERQCNNLIPFHALLDSPHSAILVIHRTDAELHREGSPLGIIFVEP
jgi:hypothetical protein